jgi:hypothetical protein
MILSFSHRSPQLPAPPGGSEKKTEPPMDTDEHRYRKETFITAKDAKFREVQLLISEICGQAFGPSFPS